MTKPKNIYFKIRKHLLKKIPILRKNGVRQFVKSSALGGAGHATQILILFLFTEFLGFYYLISSTIGFFAGISVNYFLNKKYVFKEKIEDDLAQKYGKYIVISLISLIIILAVLYVFTEFVKVYYLISQIIAVVIAFSFKFFLMKAWIFNK